MEKFKIIERVQFNDRYAYVLNRMPEFVYELHENILYAKDGPFVRVLKFERASKYFRAFVGRKFDIPMADGSIIKASGHWWDGGTRVYEELKNTKLINATVSTKEDLLDGYCFTGMYADHLEMQELILKFNTSKPKAHRFAVNDKICVRYDDYRKIINYDALFHKLHKREKFYKNKCASLIKEVKRLAGLVKQNN